MALARWIPPYSECGIPVAPEACTVENSLFDVWSCLSQVQDQVLMLMFKARGCVALGGSLLLSCRKSECRQSGQLAAVQSFSSGRLWDPGSFLE